MDFSRESWNSAEEYTFVPAIPKEAVSPVPQMQVSAISLLGGRKSQQDSLDYCVLSNGVFAAVVCDGMGGLNGGEIASRAACNGFLREYERSSLQGTPDLRRIAQKLDQEVFDLKGADGNFLNGGSTIVAAVIQEKCFSWLSVGDSRIGLLRGGKLQWLNRLHNYQMELDEAFRAGEMAQDEYQAELSKGRALLSYLGCGELKYIDTQSNVPWLPGDRILLCSDGFYDLLTPQELGSALQEPGRGTYDLIPVLLSRLETKGKSADNTSAIVIQYERRSEKQ